MEMQHSKMMAVRYGYTPALNDYISRMERAQNMYDAQVTSSAILQIVAKMATASRPQSHCGIPNTISNKNLGKGPSDQLKSFQRQTSVRFAEVSEVCFFDKEAAPKDSGKVSFGMSNVGDDGTGSKAWRKKVQKLKENIKCREHGLKKARARTYCSCVIHFAYEEASRRSSGSMKSKDDAPQPTICPNSNELASESSLDSSVPRHRPVAEVYLQAMREVYDIMAEFERKYAGIFKHIERMRSLSQTAIKHIQEIFPVRSKRWRDFYAETEDSVDDAAEGITTGSVSPKPVREYKVWSSCAQGWQFDKVIKAINEYKTFLEDV
ncbi:hypothetical protein EDD36DRAFT_414514 [Exophiala viscosa]|uniref:Uncharacterized protein n=1 Tax=Exophiala viscosa TaxID=2486360 RepID=A0AAN6E6J5_9EURO|nr:hypothetical protein EDD36DRAFT_414514 [Exophiala viscosa]